MQSSTQPAPVSKKHIWAGRIISALPVLYLIPRTSVLGAILLTGYPGGAVATHVRVGEGLFPISLPIIFGVLIWGGLYLRDERLPKLIPLSHEGERL